MVLEAIGAFALACNILQVVEYGAKVVCKAGSIHRSNPGDTSEIDDLDAIAQHLNQLNKDLGDFVAQSAVSGPLQTRLIECNAESLRLSQKFIEFLAKLRPKSADITHKPSWAESVRSAIRMRWHQDEIKDMQMALSQAKSNLVMAFLLHMSSTSQEATWAASSGSEKSMLAAIDKTSKKLHDEITSLVQQMSSMKVEESTCKCLFENFQTSNANAISRLSLNVEAILLDQQAIRLGGDTKRAETIQRRILRSLFFADMELRRGQIQEAYEDTYRWILGGPYSSEKGHSGFQEWVDSPNTSCHLFWISGKPGSGKSTLMQYLAQNVSYSYCSRWCSGQNLFVVDFFLWNPGRGLQKSLEGLLRAILHQCLFHHPWSIESVVGEKKWSIAESADLDIIWSTSDLKKAIETCLDRISMVRKVLVLLDGLDELQGGDENRQEILDFLQNLTRFESVKLCVSSRPWNIFADTFHTSPKICLQDLTRPDIDIYVRRSLACSLSLQSKYLQNSDEGKNLIDDIVNKASGVFLWVRLVVNELLRGFRDGETIRTLRRKVDSMPADLNGFFRRMIDSIDPSYRREASAFLQTALLSLRDERIEWPRGLLEFSLLEAEDPEFIAKSGYDFSELNLIDLKAAEYRIELVKRRLNSRCMGLLEWVHRPMLNQAEGYQDPQDTSKPYAIGLSLLQIDVNFLHRSLMDFLLTVDAQNILQQLTNGQFRAKVFLCSALLAKLVAITAKCLNDRNSNELRFKVWGTRLVQETHSLLRALEKSKNISSAALRVFMVRLQPTLELLQNAQALVDAKTLIQGYSPYPVQPRNLLKTIAVRYGVTGLIREYLVCNLVNHNEKNILLEQALQHSCLNTIHQELIHCLLEGGANPNAKGTGLYGLWEEFIDSIGVNPHLSSDRVQVMRLMIEYNADIDVSLSPGIARCLFRANQKLTFKQLLESLNLSDEDRATLKSIIQKKETSKTLEAGNATPETTEPTKKKRKRIQTASIGTKRRSTRKR